MVPTPMRPKVRGVLGPSHLSATIAAAALRMA